MKIDLSKFKLRSPLGPTPALVWLAVCLIFVVVFYSAPLLTLHEKWAALDESYSHGYLVILLVLYWIISQFYREPPQFFPGAVALLAAIFSSLLFFFGWSTQMVVIQQLSIPCIFVSLLMSGLGWRGVKSIILPLSFILLALPMWDAVVPLLRVATTKVVQYWVYLSNIPAYVDGFKIELPYGTLKVAGGCAGLNFFMVGAVIGAANAYQNARTHFWRLAYIGLALAFSVFGNWLRVYFLVLIAYFSRMESNIVYNHGTFGWVVFSVVLVLYFVLVHFLNVRWGTKYTSQDKVVDDGAMERPRECEDERGVRSEPVSYGRSVIPFAVFAILLFGPLKVAIKQDVSTKIEFEGLALDESVWRRVAKPKFEAQFSHWDSQVHRSYLPLKGVELSVYTYVEQYQGKEMIYYSNIVSGEDETYSIGELKLQNLPELNYSVVQGRFNYFLVLWNYRVGSRFTNSDLRGKLLQFSESLFGETQSAALLMSFSCEDDLCGDLLAKIETDPEYIRALNSVWGIADEV